jgi:hypothetical protein
MNRSFKIYIKDTISKRNNSQELHNTWKASPQSYTTMAKKKVISLQTIRAIILMKVSVNLKLSNIQAKRHQI